MKDSWSESDFKIDIDPEGKTITIWLGGDGYQMPAKDAFEIGLYIASCSVVANGSIPSTKGELMDRLHKSEVNSKSSRNH